MIVQIYEIQDPSEAQGCIQAGVDRIGSVLLDGSTWRDPLIREVVRLGTGTPVEYSLIPLFNDLDTLCRALDYYRPHQVHFCDTLTDPRGHTLDLSPFISLQVAIKTRFPEIRIMRTIPVPVQGRDHVPTLELARALEPVSDLFLLDTFVPEAPVSGYIGITGKTADSASALEVVAQSRIPVILAGGLGPENVAEKALRVRPAGVDSCTRTNLTDANGEPIRFRKDFRRVRRFVEEVRRVEQILETERQHLVKRLETARSELRQLEAALPAHSVKPHHLLRIEELEAEIARHQADLQALERALAQHGAGVPST